jgi:membrane-anchored protein YejM (alkaline phosphatase superfamily)
MASAMLVTLGISTASASPVTSKSDKRTQEITQEQETTQKQDITQKQEEIAQKRAEIEQKKQQFATKQDEWQSYKKGLSDKRSNLMSNKGLNQDLLSENRQLRSQIETALQKLKDSATTLPDETVAALKDYNDQIKAIQPAQDWWLNNDLRVPLIIYSKGQQPETIHTIGGQVDLMPTVANLFGFDEKEYSSTVFGRNLLNTNKNFVLLANGEIRGDVNEKDKAEIQRGLEYADMAIRSNYFKK